MSVLFFILISISILFFVSGVYVFVIACVRRKDMPWLVKEEMEKTPYAKYFPYISDANKWLQDHGALDVFTESRDHLKLHGLWVPAKEPIGTVICAHGYRSTFLVDYCKAFPYFHELGLNILVTTQRSHGKSEGSFITFGVKESDDLQQWIEFHNRNYGPFPVVMFGISMGATSVLFLADRKLPDNVKGIIGDCGFTSPKEIISSVFSRVIKLPHKTTIWIADKIAWLIAGFRFDECDTRVALKNAKLPVLLIHGTNDNFVPWEMTKQAYDLCTKEKELLLVDGAEHGLSFIVDREGYIRAVTQFISKYITHIS